VHLRACLFKRHNPEELVTQQVFNYSKPFLLFNSVDIQKDLAGFTLFTDHEGP
jgi:hypothetical protein